MSCSRNEVGHYFFTERLHLVNCVLLDVVCNLDVILNLSNRPLVFFLSSLQLLDVLIVHAKCHIGHNLFPLCKGCKFVVPVDSVDASLQELLCEFEPLDKHDPRVPHISFAHLSPLRFKPLALLLDKGFAFLCRALVPKLDEVVASSVSQDCFGSDEHTSFQVIQTLGPSHPSVVAPPQHLPVEHVPYAF